MGNSRKLIIEVVGDSKGLSRELGKSQKAISSFGKSVSVSLGSLVKVGAAVAGLGAITAAVRAGTSEFSDQQKVAAQTAAVLQSTGAAAGVTAKQIDSLAASISAYSGIDDEAVQASENLLLTFTNVRNTVGKGNDVFTQATKAVTDLSVAMGIKGTNAALQVGKALNDPLRGYARLQRIGVAFTKSQVDQIKGFSKLGQTVKAQKVILAELVREFGGSAKALGDTIPGQLNKLRETFRNIGGALVGKLAPAFTVALTAANKFVQALAKAQGTRAKFNVVVDGIKGLGQRILSAVQAELSRINFSQAVAAVQQQLTAALRTIGSTLDRIDFTAVGKAIGDGVVRGAQAAAAFLQSVDWSAVGNAIVNGIRAFLTGVNWKAVAVATVKLLDAAFRANLAILKGVGAALGQALLDGVRAGLRALGVAAERLALNVVLKIVKAFDFKLLGHSIIPGVDAVVKSIEGKLDSLAAHAKGAGDAVAGAIGKAAGSTNRSAAVPTGTTRGTSSATAPVVVPVVPVVNTKVVETAAEKAKKAFERVLSGLQIGVERAQQTKQLGDDLAANQKIVAALRVRSAIVKSDLDVQHQLVAALGQQKDLLEQQAALMKGRRQANQFRALGLNAEGGDIIPGTANLKKQFASLSTRIGASTTPLSGKLKAQFAGVRKLLLGDLGALTAESRQKIADLFGTIRSTFQQESAKTSGALTKTKALDARKLLANTALSPADAKLIRSRLHGFNTGGKALAGPTAAALGGGATIVVHSTTKLDGRVLATSTTKHQEKRQARNPPRRRGGGV